MAGELLRTPTARRWLAAISLVSLALAVGLLWLVERRSFATAAPSPVAVVVRAVVPVIIGTIFWIGLTALGVWPRSVTRRVFVSVEARDRVFRRLQWWIVLPLWALYMVLRGIYPPPAPAPRSPPPVSVPGPPPSDGAIAAIAIISVVVIALTLLVARDFLRGLLRGNPWNPRDPKSWT